jgi:hypothetical protein
MYSLRLKSLIWENNLFQKLILNCNNKFLSTTTGGVQDGMNGSRAIHQESRHLGLSQFKTRDLYTFLPILT